MKNNILHDVNIELKKRRDEYYKIKSEERAKFLLNNIKVLFEDLEYDEQVIGNIRKVIVHFVAEKKASIDLLIEFLDQRLKRFDPFVEKLIEREKKDSFDVIYGTDTADQLEQFEMDEDISIERFMNYARYVPSPVNSVQFALKNLEKHLINLNDFIFIDVGSGKGRILLQASNFPFKKIVGIEISKTLHETAKKNIDIYNSEHQKCNDIDIICEDVLNFSFPNENMIIYMWATFNGEIAARFFENLFDFAKNKKINLILIFLDRVYTSIKESNKVKLFDIGNTHEHTGFTVGDRPKYFHLYFYKNNF